MDEIHLFRSIRRVWRSPGRRYYYSIASFPHFLHNLIGPSTVVRVEITSRAHYALHLMIGIAATGSVLR